MESQQIIGLIVILMGVIDAFLGRFVLAPRIDDEAQRRVINVAMLSSGVLMVVLGAAIFGGVLG